MQVKDFLIHKYLSYIFYNIRYINIIYLCKRVPIIEFWFWDDQYII